MTGKPTATNVFDVDDASSGERFTIYRCDVCCALVLNVDVTEHLEWHDQAEESA